MASRIREAATSSDGLPRKAFAYAPEADPATWKLPIYTAAGAVDEDRLPGAAAALSPGGFRGQKADIPAAAIPMVKAKLRSAYRKWKGSAAEYPASITEAMAEGTCYSCNHPTACDCDVCACPNHVPESLLDVQQGLDALEDLYGLLAGEFKDGDTVGADLIQIAIDAMLKFIPNEGRELRDAAGPTAGGMTEAAVLASLEEIGKRNSAPDQKLVQQMHDATHTLGAKHDPLKQYSGMSEAITATGNPGEVAFAESSEDGGAAFVYLSEAGAVFDDEHRTVTITPIRPGFGNKRDRFFYPMATLREATIGGLFDGLKMFRNHPRKSDEKELPERSVTDWFATTRKATWSEAKQEPRVDVVVHDEADYRRWKDAPEQIAFSIKGGGMAREGSVNGQDARIVESLQKIRSVDWVTEAGAGGAIAIAESAVEEFEMQIKDLTTEQLREELRIREADAEPEPTTEVKTEVKTDVEAPKVEPEAPKPEAQPEPEVTKIDVKVEPVSPAASGGTGPVPAPEGFVSRDEFDALKARLDRPEILKESAKAVAAEMATSTLPKGVKAVIAAEFVESGWGNGFAYTDESHLRGAVKGELAKAAQMLAAVGKAPSPVKGLGGAADGQDSIREAVVDRLSKRWGDERMPERAVTVIRAEDIGKEIKVVKADSGDDDDAGTPASNLSEASAKVGDRIAAKFGM
jgi:hypothetical protein